MGGYSLEIADHHGHVMKERNVDAVTIRPLRAEDGEIAGEIFFDAVHQSAAEHYALNSVKFGLDHPRTHPGRRKGLSALTVLGRS